MEFKSRFTFCGFLLSLLLTGCATTPKFNLIDVDRSITPQQAAANPQNYRNQKVIWGGIIIAGQNLKNSTMLEILAYPLNDHYKPQTNAQPIGRFIAQYDKYLETLDYSKGRLITVSGSLINTVKGMIGKTEYTYPEISVEQSYLWPRPGESNSNTRFYFGVGAVFH